MKKPRMPRWLQKFMPVALDATGAILLSIGASLVFFPAGFITAGIALLAINWRLHGD